MASDWVDEICAAKALIWATGIDEPNAFEFRVEAPAGPRGKRNDRYSVLIKFDGVTRRYEGGEGKEWVTTFEQDIANGWDNAADVTRTA